MMAEMTRDKVAYHTTLYQKSPAHRLARINHTRKRRGMDPIDSLDEVKLRNSKSTDNKEV